LGVRTVPSEHKDRYPLSVLSSVLGGGMSSRLFSEIREKRGLAYYVRSNSDHYQDCGSFVSMAGLDPKRIDDAIKVIIEEYKKIGENGGQMKKEELKKAKEYLKGHTVLELEDSRAVAGFYAHQELLEDKIENPEVVLQKIDAVTTDHVAEVAEKYLVKNPLNLAIIGNFEDGQRFEKLLE
jgi:predicted Zn-dependent peptidase